MTLRGLLRCVQAHEERPAKAPARRNFRRFGQRVPGPCIKRVTRIIPPRRPTAMADVAGSLVAAAAHSAAQPPSQLARPSRRRAPPQCIACLCRFCLRPARPRLCACLTMARRGHLRWPDSTPQTQQQLDHDRHRYRLEGRGERVELLICLVLVRDRDIAPNEVIRHAGSSRLFATRGQRSTRFRISQARPLGGTLGALRPEPPVASRPPSTARQPLEPRRSPGNPTAETDSMPEEADRYNRSQGQIPW
jgi:hypothetical protein